MAWVIEWMKAKEAKKVADEKKRIADDCPCTNSMTSITPNKLQ